jgi:hypothetical protein
MEKKILRAMADLVPGPRSGDIAEKLDVLSSLWGLSATILFKRNDLEPDAWVYMFRCAIIR